jgi:hypothetical protein
MNTDEMTDEQMRKAIAEEMGFAHVQVGAGYGYLSNGHAKSIPRYLEDLNACAEFEKTIMPGKYEKYLAVLAVIVGNDFYEHKTHWSPYAESATARQRAIAFLKTLP